MSVQFIISGRNEREREKIQKGEEEREGSQEEAEDDASERKTQIGLAPGPLRMSHCVEDKVPLCRFDVGSEVLVETLTRAGVLTLDFKGLTYFQAIGQAFFALTAHCFEHRWVFPVHRLVARLLVLGDS